MPLTDADRRSKLALRGMSLAARQFTSAPTKRTWPLTENTTMFDEKKDLPPMESRDPSDRKPMVTGVFRDRDSAERGWAVAERHGYNRDQVSVLVSEEGRKRH